MKPETVLRAARLIRTGEVFELGRVLSESIPLSVGRRFEVITKRSRMDPGSNHRGSNEELVVAEIGQVGTQFDTFSHQMVGTSMYSCFKLDEIASRTGFTKLGVENVGALVTRAVMIDVAALKGADMLPNTYEITAQDLQQGLARQDPMLVGSDNGAVEISPNPNPQLAGPVHQIMLVVNGIHLLENLKLDALAERQVYESALIVEPLKIQGGTLSTVAPVAIH
jgi:hypothetical protein